VESVKGLVQVTPYPLEESKQIEGETKDDTGCQNSQSPSIDGGSISLEKLESSLEKTEFDVSRPSTLYYDIMNTTSHHQERTTVQHQQQHFQLNETLSQISHPSG
jgi:hypothetical protein